MQSIQQMWVDYFDKEKATAKNIAKEFTSIAFSDIKDYLTIAEGGEIQAISLDKIKGCKSKAIKKVKEKTNIVEKGEVIFKTSQVEYELYDKMEALKFIVKLRGEEPADKHEHTGKDGSPLGIILERIDGKTRGLPNGE